MSDNSYTTDRDRDICALLGTTATELEQLIGKSRQTISKHMKKGDFFGIDEIVKVASAKFPDDLERSQVISRVLKEYFPDILKYAYTKDFDVHRFSQYYIFGMDVHNEIETNSAFEKFVSEILSDESKFILFASAPVRPYAHLKAWLQRFQKQKHHSLGSFILVPCKLTELTPVQVLADPWTTNPQLIQVDEHSAYVDTQNSQRATQIASSLKQYGGRAARDCASDETDENREKAAKQLMGQLNHSMLDDVPLPEEPLTHFSHHR